MNEQILEKIIALRHTLHRYPELSMREQKTMVRIKAFLRENTTVRIVGRDSWFYAVKPGSDPSSRPIAFRADMDALPIQESGDLPYASSCDGVSHKCGHDGHTAALCGLALALEETPPERTVYLIFQPGEEIGAGGERCAALLREKGISEVYAFHNMSGYPEGTVVYRNGLTSPASEGLTIRFHGKQSHASAPEDGQNPASAVSRLALYSQECLERPRSGMVLCTVIGISVGNRDFGVSPGEGSICLTLRAEQESEMKQLEADLLRYAAEQAGENELRLEYEISDYFPETRNHPEGLRRVLHCAEKQSIPTLEMDHLWRASEDFGYYLKQCPGAMFYIGNGVEYPALHTQEYDFNDRILTTAVSMLTGLALDTDPD